MQAQLPVVLLAGLCLVGIALTYFAYEITGLLLALIGYAVGGGVGIGVGLAVQSEAGGGGNGLLVLGGAVLIGAILGRVIVPALSKIAMGALGFITTALAALAMLTQGRVAEAIRLSLPTTDAQVPPEQLLEFVLADPSLQGQALQETVLIAVGIGVVGGLIAMAYYRAVMSVVLTGVGAGVISIVGPALLDVFNNTDPEALASDPGIAPLWLVVALATGALFQYARHNDDPKGA